MFATLSAWEGPALLWVQQFIRNGVLDPMVSLFSRLGDHGILWIALTLLLLLFPKTRKLGFAAALALICSLLFTNIILKHIFQRPRPWLDFTSLIPLVDERDPNSFPSGHSSAAFAFAVATFRLWPKKWMTVTATALAACMALSRLYVGVHYPSDVLVGTLVGALAGLCGYLLSRKILQLWKARRARA